jgi:lysozyme family protein
MADYKLILPYVKVEEGGLSSWQKDSAKDNPSPFQNLKKGTVDYGYYYHTNKGVLWTTFVAYSKKNNIPVVGKNWLYLSDDTWKKILKSLYWDSINADKINSQGIAEILFEAVWGGTSEPLYIYLQNYLREKNYDIKSDGIIGVNTIKALNDYTKNKDKEIQLIKDLTKKRFEILKSLGGWKTASKAWSRRLVSAEKRAIEYAKVVVEIVAKNPKTTTIISILVIGVGAYLLKFGLPKINTWK